MKVLILGAKGLLGEALQKVFNDHEVIAYDREELDVTDFSAMRETISVLKPDVIINCVAWNDVDGAEKEKERERIGETNRAKLLNTRVPEELARIARDRHAIFVTYSTDHVFDGENHNGYRENDTPNPVNAYGASKYLGEQAVVREAEKFYLIRTSRLYGEKPRSVAAKTSFVLMMVELARSKKELSVVNEEPGAFTYVKDLAEATRKLIEEKFSYGIYHCMASGAVSWYECARMIFDFLKLDVRLQGVPRSKFSRLAKMPRYSILLNTKFPPLRDWKEMLEEFLRSYV